MATDLSQPDLGDQRARVVPTDVLIVGTLGGGGIHQYVEDQAKRLDGTFDVTVHDMVTPDTGSGPGWLVLSVLRSLLALGRFAFREPPDVVHVHTSHRFSFYRAAPYVVLAAYLWDRPVVLHVHGSSFDEFADSDDAAVRWLQSAVFGAADRVVVLSEYWRDVLSDRVAPEKIAVFPNAVDPSEYDPEFGDDPLHVVFVSNLIERKGVPELLATLRALDERGLAYRATIAGKGPLADAVEQLAANSPNVEYVGYVSENHKRELLDAGAIYALPTHAEGLPIAMLEGMAGGNAVVSTTVGSIPEVIEETGGILLEPGDSDGLAEALAALIADPDRARAMARRNRALVEEEYAWAETTDRLAELYATVQRDHVARS